MTDDFQQDPNSGGGMAAAAVQAALLVPALSVMVFFRHGVGFRIVRYQQIAFSFAVMMLLAIVFGPGLAMLPGDVSFRGAGLILILALAFLPLAIYQNRQDWRRIVGGQPGSSWARGIPRLAAIVPIRADLLAQYGEPAVCLAIGLATLFSWPLFSLWILMGGLFMAAHESIARERYLCAILDMLDAEYYGNRLNEEIQGVKGGSATASTSEPAYDGVMPSLPPAMADKVRDRQRLWQERQAAAAADDVFRERIASIEANPPTDEDIQDSYDLQVELAKEQGIDLSLVPTPAEIRELITPTGQRELPPDNRA